MAPSGAAVLRAWSAMPPALQAQQRKAAVLVVGTCTCVLAVVCWQAASNMYICAVIVTATVVLLQSVGRGVAIMRAWLLWHGACQVLLLQPGMLPCTAKQSAWYTEQPRDIIVF